MYWDAGDTTHGMLFVEPYSKVYDPLGPIYYDNQFQASDWFNDWFWRMKSVKLKFSGTAIIDWYLAVDGQYIDTQGAVITTSGDRFSTFNLDYTIWENNDPGSWNLIGVSEVPVPATGLLLIGALGLLGLRRTRIGWCPFVRRGRSGN